MGRLASFFTSIGILALFLDGIGVVSVVVLAASVILVIVTVGRNHGLGVDSLTVVLAAKLGERVVL